MLTVMTSDHGESLGEHNYWFDHGMFGFQTCLHVPLVVRYPGVIEPRVDSDPVELIARRADASSSSPGGASETAAGCAVGRSSAAASAASARPRRTIAFAEAGYSRNGGWIRVAMDGHFTLHRLSTAADRKRVGGHANADFALFDLRSDPGETDQRRRPPSRASSIDFAGARRRGRAQAALPARIATPSDCGAGREVDEGHRGRS